MLGVGIKDNPILLTPESHLSGVESPQLYEERNLLLQDSILGKDGLSGLQEVKYHKDRDYFILNVITNSWLNFKEVKVATYLHERIMDFDGEVFSVSDRDIMRKNKAGNSSINVGQYGCIQIGNETSTKKRESVEIESIDSLSHLLENDLGLIIDTPRLAGILRKLHSYSYITITNITWWNTRDGLSGLREQFHKGKLTSEDCIYNTSGRSVLKHIRICRRMMRVNMLGKWIWRM